VVGRFGEYPYLVFSKGGRVKKRLDSISSTRVVASSNCVDIASNFTLF